ncbi:MAG: DUF5107 domain-containing protein, partial [Bacteroidota bacterium]
MRRFIALATVVLVALAGCTPPPFATPPASPAAASTSAPAAGTPVAAVTASRGLASDETPAATGVAAPSPAPLSNDHTKPALSITVDPPQIDWEGQAIITVRASDPAGIKELTVLLGDQVLATGDGEDLELEFIPGAIDGLQGGTSYDLVARATDLSGNAAEASTPIKVGPEPTDTPDSTAAATPSASSGKTEAATATPATGKPAAQTPKPTSEPAVSGTDVITSTRDTTTYRVTEIKLLTYPYAGYLRQTTDPDREDYPVLSLDQSAYSASNPQPQMKAYRLLVLENRYLRLGILPDLGGRIYECVFKPTGSNEFYSNTVIKPTTWGPGSPPYPPGANWWPAAGGLEWGFPVEEHGYEFGTVWGFDHVSQDDGGVMITVFTKTGPQNPYAVVDIILPPDTAYFVVQPRVVNPLGGPFSFKFWENAMLAPGKANSVSPDLRFVFPASQVTVHSTGDATLPQAGQTMSWPVVKPTNWGPPSPPYVPGANWWLGTGGLEWGFPVEEHGYEWGTVWGFDHAAQDDGGLMITVYTQTGPEKPYAVVDIILPPDTAY